MTREEIKALLKITDRTINLVLVFRRALIDLKQAEEQKYLIRAAADFNIELTDYRFYLKRLLKGDDTQDLPEQLRWLLAEINKAKDKNVQKIYQNKILELSAKYFSEGLEVSNGPKGTTDSNN
ncbi:hypothetical protein ES703_52933 [subsurface metagenome]